jgi:SAM-dependent MidA family methyltransferase
MKISELIRRQLFSKEGGYYKIKNPIGKSQDFITAPEISQIFGEIMAVYLLELSKNSANKIALVEMGAGHGTWLGDILQTIENLANKSQKIAQEFLKNTEIFIVETSPQLQKIQQQNLIKHKIKWCENFAEFLAKSSGEIYFISNELFDCFAIDQYVKTANGWQERLIEFSDKQNLSNPQFAISKTYYNDFVESQIGKALSFIAPLQAVFEYSLDAQLFMKQLSQAIFNRGGFAINIDYGYLNYDFANTLQTIKNHQKIPFLEGFREGDITALVDFFALDNIAKKNQLKTSLISQREFLLSLGAESRLESLIKKNPKIADNLQNDFDRLINPSQMGELFKVHIIWK